MRSSKSSSFSQSPAKKRQPKKQRQFRESLRLESLERRDLMTVSSQLESGILRVDFTDDRDSAQVSVNRDELLITSGSGTESFAIRDVLAIRVDGETGAAQSISFSSSLVLANELDVRGIESVVFTEGNYQVGSLAVVSPGSIEFEQFGLSTAGNVVLEAKQTLNDTDTVLLDRIGVTAEAENSVRFFRSSLTGSQIDVLAQTEIVATSASDEAEDDSQDLSRVNAVGAASIIVEASELVASRSLSLTSESLQTIIATAVPPSENNDTARDAAIALSKATSSSLVHLTSSSLVRAGLNLNLAANNVLTVTTNADGAAAAGGKGGTVARSNVDESTQIIIDSGVTIIARAVFVNADSQTNLATSATSTAGGTTGNDQSTAEDLASNNASTSGGRLGVAAAYARAIVNRNTKVALGDGVSITSDEGVLVATDASGNLNTTANGSSTNDGAGSDGLGIAIALNKVTDSNQVVVEGNVDLASPRITLQVTSNGSDQHSAQATSGAGSDDVGVAGSFARNVVESVHEVLLSETSAIDVHGATLTLRVDRQTTVNTDARPAESDSSSQRGFGASVAQSRVDSRTSTVIGTAARILNASVVNISNQANEDVTTTATTGAEGGSAITPGVATAVVNSNVQVAFAAGEELSFDRDLQVNTLHSGDITTTVAGDVLGEQAARGGAFALNDVDIQSNVTVDRALTAAGDMGLVSETSGTARTSAKSSATGTGESDATADDQILAEQQVVGSDQQTPSADAKGKVAAAAASAVNLVRSFANAILRPAGRLISRGTLQVKAGNATDASSAANASAVGSGTNGSGGTERGRAISVAINKAEVSSGVDVEATQLAASTGLTLQAGEAVGDDRSREFSADAISGAGAREVGFAGAFALNKVLNTSDVELANSTSLDLGLGALTIQADNSATNQATATPSIATTGETRGVGASFALNIAENVTTVTLPAGVTIVSDPAASDTRSSIGANSTQSVVTTASGGAGAESEPGEMALTPVFAIQAVSNTTQLDVAPTTATFAGSLELQAELALVADLNATGSATAAETARGLVLALDISNNQTDASVAGTIDVGQGLAIEASTNVNQSTTALASAKGGDTSAIEGGTDKETADAKRLAIDAGAKDNGENSPEQKTPDGSVAFAGALAVALARTTTNATIESNTQLTSGEAVSINAEHNVSADLQATATAVTVAADEAEQAGEEEEETADASGRGTGVAIGVHVNKVTTNAHVAPSARIIAKGLSVLSGNTDGSTSEFNTDAVSGAGGGKVGNAGSLAIQVVHHTASAVLDAARVDAGDGSIQVKANNRSNATAEATPSTNASGSQRGRGISATVHVVRNTTLAEVAQGASLRDLNEDGQISGGLDVQATSTNNVTTNARGGAGSETDTGEAASTGVFGLSRVVNVTEATLHGTENFRNTVEGNVNVQATQAGTTTTDAKGDSRAEQTSVGIVVGLQFVKDTTTATVHDSWSTAGDMNIQAVSTADSTANATASARGGDADKENSLPEKGEVDIKVSESKNLLEQTDGQAVDDEAPDSKAPDGSLALAGSLAVNVTRHETQAVVSTTADLDIARQLRIAAQSQAIVDSNSDASAVFIPEDEDNQANGEGNNVVAEASQTGVGVAININAPRITTHAKIEGNAQVRAVSVDVDAGTALDGEADHTFRAEAISGAGVDKVGFAGVLTIQTIRNDVLAEIGPGATLELVPSTDPDLVSTSQDVSVRSRNETSTQATATADITNNPRTGIGPSIVVHVAENSSRALVSGAIFNSDVGDLTADADGDYISVTRSTSGAKARPTLAGDGGFALSPALGVSVHNNTTTAQVEEGNLFEPVNVLGNLSILTTHDNQTNGRSEATVNATGNAAVGTPLFANIALDDAQALVTGRFEVAGDATVHSLSDLQVLASADATVTGARMGDQSAASLTDRAQQWATGFRREPGEEREKILDRLEDRLTDAGDKLEELSSAKAEGTGIAASAVANISLSKVRAEVAGSLAAGGNVQVVAEGDRDAVAHASSLAVSPTLANALGGAIAVNIADQSIHALAHGNGRLSGESITVRAGKKVDEHHLLAARAVAGGGAKEDSKAGSIAVNIANDDIEASIGKSPLPDAVTNLLVESQQGVSIRAESDLQVQNIAGGAALGFEGDGVGGALAVNVLNTDTFAGTGASTTMNIAGALQVRALSHVAPPAGDLPGDPVTLAASGAAGGSQTHAGAAAVTVISESTVAEIGDDNVITTNTGFGVRGTVIPGNVLVQADSTTDLNAGAGALSIGLKLGRGIGVAANILNKTVEANVGDQTSIDASGDIDINASSIEDIVSIAAAPAFGGAVNKPNYGGAIQLSSQVVDVQARVGESTNIQVDGDMSVISEHDVDLDVITGAIAAAQNNSVAGSLNIISLLNRSEALVAANAQIAVRGEEGISVIARSQEDVLPVAIGGTGAGDNASAGSITLTRIHETTLAHIDTGAIVQAVHPTGAHRPSITVHAEDFTTFESGAGVVAIAGKQGIGGSIDALKIDKSTRAYVADGTQLQAAQDITVTANSREDVLSVAASAVVSGSTSILGALSGHAINVTTQAVLGDDPTDLVAPSSPAVAHANGSVVVDAVDNSEMDFIDGGVGISGGNSVGGAASIAVIHKQTEATIADLARISANASTADPAINAKTGKFDISFTNGPFDSNRVAPPTFDFVDSDEDEQDDLLDPSFRHPRTAVATVQSKRGVLVTASNTDDVATIVAGAGIGSGFSLGLSIPASVLRADTIAAIGDQAQINIGNESAANSNQEVLVAAGSDFSHLSISGALGLAGQTGIAPAGNIASTKLNTSASIGSSTSVSAKKDVAVNASANEDSLLVTAAGSGGGNGGSGSVAYYSLDNVTHAYIDSQANVSARGNIVVEASDDTDLDAVTGAAAFGGGAGISLSMGINRIHKDTQAFIGEDATLIALANTTNVPVLSEVDSTGLTTTLGRGVIVQATSTEDLLTISASGAGGGLAGAGSGNVHIIDSDTTAFIGDSSTVNVDAAGVNALQSVFVQAGNHAKARSIAGGLSIGAAAIAGSADVGVVRNDTSSFIGDNATINSREDIVVQSLALEQVNSLAVSGGASGSLSFAAAVAVWSLGTKFDSSYSDDNATTDSLDNGEEPTISEQIALEAEANRNGLRTALGNVAHVNDNTTPATPTPAEQLGELLRGSKLQLESELPTAGQLSSDLLDDSNLTGTTASVHPGARLIAEDDVTVEATTHVDLNTISGSASLSAVAAVGAAVTVQRTRLKTDVSFAGSIEAANDVFIQSRSNIGAEGKGFAGTGAIGGALGAVVTTVRDDSSTTTRVDGSPNQSAQIQQAGDVIVAANSSTTLTSLSGQGAIAGGGAAGVTVSKSVADGQTQTLVGDHVQVGQTQGKVVDTLQVLAASNNFINADAKALAAGIGGALTLNFATAEATPLVKSALGSTTAVSNSNIKTSGDVMIGASDRISTAADMIGVTLAAGAALGFSRAKSIVSPTVEAAVGRSTHVDAGGNLAVQAIHNRPVVITSPNGSVITQEFGANANAEAGAAAAIAGNTARAFTTMEPTVSASVFQDASVVATGQVDVVAESHNRAISNGGSLTVGLAAAGGVEVTTEIRGSAAAQLRDGSSVIANQVSVLADAQDRGLAEGVAATGGVVSGNAVSVNSTIDSRDIVRGVTLANASANVVGANIQTPGQLTVQANHIAEADAFAKGVAIGGLLTAGQSDALVSVTPLVTSNVDNSSIVADSIFIRTKFGDFSNPSLTAMDVAEDEATLKDERSIAFAKGSGGALIGDIGSSATTVHRPKLDTTVHASTITAGNVRVEADADATAAAIARNVSVGLIALGDSRANLSMKQDLSASVDGTAEFGETNIDSANDIVIRVDSDQIGDAFSNTRAIAGLPVGRATTTIDGTYDLTASVGDNSTLTAADSIVIESEVSLADLGSQKFADPDDPTNRFGRPNYIGANANADTDGIAADSFASASTRLGTAATPATAVASLGSFSLLKAPNVTLQSDVNSIDLDADASARSGGLLINVSSTAVGEVHSDVRVDLKADSTIDATNTVIQALNGTSSTGIEAEVESTTDKDGIDFTPNAVGIIRMDTSSTVNGFNESNIATRNLQVRADTDVTQFDLLVLENDTPRANSGTRISEFIRDREIHWDSDVLIKGRPAPRLTVVPDDRGGAIVTEAIGVSIQDTDGSGLDDGTLGNVQAPTIIVNPINNAGLYGSILFEIPRRGPATSDTGTIDGLLGSFTVQRGFDDIVISNTSTKPLIVNSISSINMQTPLVVVNAPDSSTLSFPVFQNFGDTQITIENGSKTAIPSLTLNGLINNPVGETSIDAAGSILRTGNGKIVSNVVDIDSASGNIGSSSQRIPIDLVLSNGRTQDLDLNSSGSMFLDLTARDRRFNATTPVHIDVSNIEATGALNVQFRPTVRENTLPNALPLLTVNEVQEVDITEVVSFFETEEQSLLGLDLGALGVNPTAVASEWEFNRLAGSSINASLIASQLTGPRMSLTANTDVGSSNIVSLMNGDIALTESSGPMRVSNIESTLGNVTLSSNSSIIATPADAGADVSGGTIQLNAASIGTAASRVDVNSRDRLNANSVGDVFLTETVGDLPLGSITVTNGNADLLVSQGSLLDIDNDSAVEVSANNITLAAPAGSIGTNLNAIEINSASTGHGSVRASAQGDIQLIEVTGNLSLVQAESTQGNIRITVPDTADANSNLKLADAIVTAPLGAVQLLVGDNVTSTANTLVQASVFQLSADAGNFDPGVGSSLQLAGSFSAGTMSIATAADSDTIVFMQTTLQGPLTLSTSSGDDSIVIDQLAPYTSSTAGVRDVLAVALGNGTNTIEVVSSPTGNFAAIVTDNDRFANNVLHLTGTDANDAILLNRAQAGFVHPGSLPTSELVSFGDRVDQVAIIGRGGNDNLAIDLAPGNVEFYGGVSFQGNEGTDLVLVSGSPEADIFELQAFGPSSGRLRTRVGADEYYQPIDVETIEVVSLNGLLPSAAPGDTLIVLNSITDNPTLPSGSLTTPLPVFYTNLEAVQIGSLPRANNDGIHILEDEVGIVFPFRNDTGLADVPVTVSMSNPGFGSVAYDNNGTPNDFHDDRFIFTPAAHVSGNTSFDYTLTDSNGDSSTARVFIIVDAVADAPLVAVRDASGAEGRPIPLDASVELVDRDGSESLEILVKGLPERALLTNAEGVVIGRELETGRWSLTLEELRDLHVLFADNGSFELTLEAIATELDAREPASTEMSFRVDASNTAPDAVVMEAPRAAIRGQQIELRMAAEDDSDIDQEAGFRYRVNWGDGSSEDFVSGSQPTLLHTYQSSGEYTISVYATDKDGSEGTPASHHLTIEGSGIIADPLRPGDTMLVVEGTPQSDTISISRSGNVINVSRNGTRRDSFAIPTSRLVVWGLDGNDVITVASNVPVDSWLFGGDGNDLLTGGSHSSILVGGDGIDILRGQGSRDILFGGDDTDLLIGGGDDDIMLAGTSIFDEDEAALFDIQQEWTSNRSRKARIQNLTVGTATRDNGDTFLRGEGASPTAFDDGDIDLLINQRLLDWVLVNSDVGKVDLFVPTPFKEELGPDASSGKSESSDGDSLNFDGDSRRKTGMSASSPSKQDATTSDVMRSLAFAHAANFDDLWLEVEEQAKKGKRQIK